MLVGALADSEDAAHSHEVAAAVVVLSGCFPFSTMGEGLKGAVVWRLAMRLPHFAFWFGGPHLENKTIA
jgi:hypothetical protein